MKKLSLFSRFMVLLVAMMSMSVSQVWAAKITSYSGLVAGKSYYIGATTSKTDYYLKVDGSSTGTGKAGTAVTTKADATVFTLTGAENTWAIQFANGNFLYLKDGKDNGKVGVSASPMMWTATDKTGKINFAINGYALQKNNSGTQFGSYASTQTDIWFEEVSSDPAVSLSPKTIDFGDVYQNASVDPKTIAATLSNTTSATVAISGTAFTITPTELTKSGDITITPASTATIGEFQEELIISATGAKADTAIVTMNVVAAPKEIVSIAVSGTPTKTTYEAGQTLDPAGLVVTATYADASQGEVTEDAEWLFDPEVFKAGDTSCNLLASVGSITSEVYTVNGLTVTEHVVVPGTFDITPNNVFFNCDPFTSKPKDFTSATGTQDDITITYVAATNAYINAAQCRMYNGTKVTFSVPAGHTITAIAFTADGSNWTGDHTCNVGKMTDNKNWAGYNDTVTITFAGTCRCTKIKVTFAAEAKNDVTLAVCANGSVSADPSKAVAAGTTVTLSNTPDAGFTLDAYKVYKTDVDSVIVTVADGKFTMPAYPVTVSATFRAAKVLESIAIDPASTNPELFWVGDTFTTTGIIVKATFTGEAETEDVTASCTFSREEGVIEDELDEEITVSFTEGTVTKTTSYFINAEWMSLADLLESIVPTTTAVKVYVKLDKEPITKFYTNKGGSRNGVGLNVTYGEPEDTEEIEIYCNGVNENWKQGGTLSAKLKSVDWKLYGTTKELCPANWNDFSYNDTTTSVEALKAISGEQPAKTLYNNQVVILRNGVMYNTIGQVVK